MFRQYQRQETAGSLSALRTISGVSQSSETVDCVSEPLAEETAPSTVIELRVDELSPKSPESASSSTVTSGPPEAAGGRGHESITMSNILASTEEEEEREEQKLVQEFSENGSGGDGKETEATVTQKDDAEERSEETNEQEPVTEASNDDNTDVQTSVSDQPETDETKATGEVGDSATTPDETPGTGDEKSEAIKGESSNSMTEDSLNEAGVELPVVSEPEGKADQTSPEAAASLENSVLGGASVCNEDLVDQILTSDADESQGGSSYASAGEEVEVGQKEDDKHQDDENKEDDQEGREMKTDVEKDEKQEVGTQEEKQESLTPPAETTEQSGPEPAKEKVQDEQSSSADQQPSDTTALSAGLEVAAASDSSSPSRPSETAATAPTDGTAASNPDTRKSADPVPKTKEMNIARLDVSNVAVDTERLEFKETFTTVRIFFSTFDLLINDVAYH